MTSSRQFGGAALLLILLVAGAARCLGQATVWTATGAGNFVTPPNWSNGVPNSGTDASITNGTAGTPSIVSVNGAGGSVLDLTLAANNTLDLNVNATLGVFGTAISNDGGINVTGGSGTNTILQLNSNVTLTGSGALTLSYGDHNGNAFIEENGGSFRLTNSGSTIQGNGVIGNGGLAFTNSAGGVVNANVSGQSLTLNGTGAITNTAVLEATSGGILQISTNVANVGGTIAASSGGTVDLSAAVTGGNLTSGSGLLQTAGSATLNSITLSASSTYTGDLGTTTAIAGTITNLGTFLFISGSAANTVLTLNTNVVLSGGGTLTLNSGDINGLVFINEASANLTLNNVDNHIQGYGDIGNGGLALINFSSGMINANVPGRTLTLDGTGGVTNGGVMEGTNGGTLQISTVVNNLGGNITASAGTVNLSSTIEGGTLNSTLGGSFQTGSNSTLDGTTQGALTISSGSVFTSGLSTNTHVVGTINNSGTILLLAGSATNAFLDVDTDTILQGGGTVTLNSGDNNGQAYIQSGTSNNLTNVDNSIEGYGVIGHTGITLDNEVGGTVNANASGQTLHLNGGNILNAGLLEATGGGVLQITGMTVANAAANITADGGTVLVDGATIEGGTINALNGGVVANHGSATLDGSTLGPLSISLGTTFSGGFSTDTLVVGTLTNHGTIAFSAGSATNAFLSVDSNTTLQGGGAVVLNSGDDNGQVYIQSGNNYTLTNTDNTIEGYGNIGHSGIVLVNGAAGIVDANISGQTLLMDGGSVANSGLLEATASGTLRIATTVANVGGNITGNGGNVVFASGAVIQGGTLNALNGGTMGVGASSSVTLDGSSSALTISAGTTVSSAFSSQTNVNGTIMNQGNLQVNAGSGANTFLNVLAGATLQGGGTLTLNSGDNNGQAYVISGGGTTLTNTDNTIQGYGDVGHGSLAFVNSSSGTVDANSAGNTILLDGGGNVANAGSLEATNSGILRITNVVSNSGNVSALGGTVNITGGTIQGGTLNGVGLETTTTATLDGATNGAITLSSGGQYTSNRGTSTFALGTVDNQGSIQLIAGSGSNTFLSLPANTTLQGGGTLSLNSGDTNGQAYIQQSVGGITLTNSGDTIEGYGIIGNGGLSFMNDVAGTVLANIPGNTLQINASGTVTNNGLFEADAANLLLVSQPTNLAGNTLTGGTWTATNGGTVSFEGTVDAIVTNDATLILDGSTSVMRTKTGGGGTYQQVFQTLTTNNSTLEVVGGANFFASNAITNNGLVQLGGGILAAPGLVNNPGSTLAGFGTFSPTGGVTIGSGATLSPGGSLAGQRIATLSFGTGAIFGPGGTFVFDIKNAPSAVAGTDYDTITVPGTLFVTATSGTPFSISIRSVDPVSGGAGFANFNPMVPYSWTLATAGSISGFNPSDFSFNAAGFQNSLNGGFFSLSETGNLLTLNFTPVPEPGTWVLMLGGLGAMAASLRRRQRRGSV